MVTSRGNLKAQYKGYEYVKNKISVDSILWRCTRSFKGQCRGKALTKKFGNKQFIKVYGMHNH